MRLRFILFLAIAVAGCGQSSAPDPTAPAAAEPALTTADFGRIVERGTLRVVLGRERDTYLPRHGAAVYAEQELARRFAARHGLEMRLVFVEDFSARLPALLEGRGDIVVANLTVTDDRLQQVAFTRPLGHSVDRLAIARGNKVPGVGEALSGTVAAREGTTLLETANRLAAEHAELVVVPVSGTSTNENRIDRLANGEFDYAVQDSNVLAHILDYCPTGCRVTLVHSGFTDQVKTHEGTYGGWKDILSLLKAELETGQIPLKTRIIYAIQGAMMFMLPKSTRIEEVKKAGW